MPAVIKSRKNFSASGSPEAIGPAPALNTETLFGNRLHLRGAAIFLLISRLLKKLASPVITKVWAGVTINA
jgi:hypothetical protein